MRKILVCQHVAHELLGTLNPLFKSHGFRIKYVNFDREPFAKLSLEGYSGLVILGGPMNVDETQKHPHLSFEVKLIQDAIEKKMPVLGICLGAQLIAKALGATVTKNPVKEIGWYDLCLTEAGKQDALFQHFHPTEKMFQWHDDTFTLPEGAIHLASSPLCQNQAFRHGNKVYALQFHMEVDEPTIQRWLNVSANKQEIEELGEEIEPESILKETQHNIGRLKQLSHQSFNSFIDLFGAEKKFRRLSSR